MKEADWKKGGREEQGSALSEALQAERENCITIAEVYETWGPRDRSPPLTTSALHLSSFFCSFSFSLSLVKTFKTTPDDANYASASGGTGGERERVSKWSDESEGSS